MIDAFLSALMLAIRDTIVVLIGIGKWAQQERNRRQQRIADQLRNNIEGENP
jgi:hypothetical protein